MSHISTAISTRLGPLSFRIIGYFGLDPVAHILLGSNYFARAHPRPLGPSLPAISPLALHISIGGQLSSSFVFDTRQPTSCWSHPHQLSHLFRLILLPNLRTSGAHPVDPLIYCLHTSLLSLSRWPPLQLTSPIWACFYGNRHFARGKPQNDPPHHRPNLVFPWRCRA